MGNKSKNIGKAFERECCKILEKFFDLPFQRVPNSGAFIGGQNAFRISKLSASQTLLAKGDIIPPDELPNLIIECKKRRVIAYHQFFQDNGSKDLNEWIDQTEIDYVACGEVGVYIILFKSNNRGRFVCFLKDSGLIPNINHVYYNYNKKEYLITEFNDTFLNNNKDIIFDKCKPL